MSTSDLEYALPSDDLKRYGNWSLVAGTTTDVGYGIERLTNDNPAYPVKFNETTFRIEKDFGAVVYPQFAAVIHANLDLGYVGLTLQGNTSATWGSPAYSKTFPVATYQNNAFPVNLALDLRDDAPAYQYWSLTATTVNSVPIAIGLFVLVDAVHALNGHLLLGSNPEDDEDTPSNRHATDAGVESTFSFGTRLRWLRGEKLLDGEAEGTQIRDWHRAASGDAGRFLLLPHMEDDEPWFARFGTSKLPRQHQLPNQERFTVKLEFAEISRGLKPTPSAV
jgi:hypothetical protein